MESVSKILMYRSVTWTAQCPSHTLTCLILIAGALVGAGVALLGSHVLRFMKERAALVVGAKTPPAGVDLSVIEGLSEDDVARLAEEGIDSVHALAFTPTPRVFLNTRYSLQRICDWQDQALLIVYVGPSRAQKFREIAMIRGALDAQQLALDLLAIRRDAPASSGDPFTGPRPTLDDQAWGRVISQLGFASVEQAELALAVLLDDEVIRRLRVYWRCSGKTAGGAGEEGVDLSAVPATLRVRSYAPASQPAVVPSSRGAAG